MKKKEHDHEESWYKLNRLMSKLGQNIRPHEAEESGQELRYEDSVLELGRLQGFEEAMHLIERIKKGE